MKKFQIPICHGRCKREREGMNKSNTISLALSLPFPCLVFHINQLHKFEWNTCLWLGQVYKFPIRLKILSLG